MEAAAEVKSQLSSSQAAALRVELLARADADQAARNALPPQPEAADWQAVHDVDVANTRRLLAIVGEHGWPGHTMVGADGAHAAWMLAQHAPSDVQQFVLPLLGAAVDAGDADPVDLAYLTDRVRVSQGLGQLYGTQYLQASDDLQLSAVDEPDRLDQRRAAVGLGPHATYDTQMRQTHHADGS